MAKYRISTGLCASREEPEFSNDKDAWNYLRLLLPNKFATLYKEEDFYVPILDREEYIKAYNNKYTDKINLDDHNIKTMWIPVLYGLTSSEMK